MAWWRRSGGAEHPAPSSPLPIPVSVATPDWMQLPPLQRSLTPVDLVAPLAPFTAGLSTRGDPRFLEALGHSRGSEGPAGEVAASSAPAVEGSELGPSLPVVTWSRTSSAETGPTAQRVVSFGALAVPTITATQGQVAPSPVAPPLHASLDSPESVEVSADSPADPQGLVVGTLGVGAPGSTVSDTVQRAAPNADRGGAEDVAVLLPLTGATAQRSVDARSPVPTSKSSGGPSQPGPPPTPIVRVSAAPAASSMPLSSYVAPSSSERDRGEAPGGPKVGEEARGPHHDDRAELPESRYNTAPDAAGDAPEGAALVPTLGLDQPPLVPYAATPASASDSAEPLDGGGVPFDGPPLVLGIDLQRTVEIPAGTDDHQHPGAPPTGAPISAPPLPLAQLSEQHRDAARRPNTAPLLGSMQGQLRTGPSAGHVPPPAAPVVSRSTEPFPARTAPAPPMSVPLGAMHAASPPPASVQRSAAPSVAPTRAVVPSLVWSPTASPLLGGQTATPSLLAARPMAQSRPSAAERPGATDGGASEAGPSVQMTRFADLFPESLTSATPPTARSSAPPQGGAVGARSLLPPIRHNPPERRAAYDEPAAPLVGTVWEPVTGFRAGLPDEPRTPSEEAPQPARRAGQPAVVMPLQRMFLQAGLTDEPAAPAAAADSWSGRSSQQSPSPTDLTVASPLSTSGILRSETAQRTTPPTFAPTNMSPVVAMASPSAAHDMDEARAVWVPTGGAPGTDAVAVQRDSAATEATEPAATPAPSPAPTSPAPPSPGSAGGEPGAPGGLDIEELARRLFDPLSARLRAELWLDRERAGLIADLRR